MEQLTTAFKRIERFIAKAVKNLLVVIADETRQGKILELVSDEEVQTKVAVTRAEAFKQLHLTSYDGIILDIDIEQGAGIQFLEQLQSDESLSQIPVIIYAGRELTQQEQVIVHQYENNLTLKAVSSPGRLLEEVTLFLHQVEATLPKEKRKMLQMVHNKEAILKQKKVLIVDDDTRNTFALLTILEDKDMVVVAGKNGKEALELLEEHSDIDIVLMDIMMPEMDGYEAIQKIRAQPHLRKLPIIALTAKAMKGDKAKCIEAGANDYLAKPVDIDKLISLMRVWLYR
jgi:CheY-like chemotaxis protein